MVFISPWFVVSFIRRSLPDVILALTASLEVNAVRVIVGCRQDYGTVLSFYQIKLPFISVFLDGEDPGMRMGLA